MHEFTTVTPAGSVVAVGVHAGIKSSKSELVKIRRAKALAIEITKMWSPRLIRSTRRKLRRTRKTTHSAGMSSKTPGLYDLSLRKKKCVGISYAIDSALIF